MIVPFPTLPLDLGPTERRMLLNGVIAELRLRASSGVDLDGVYTLTLRGELDGLVVSVSRAGRWAVGGDRGRETGRDALGAAVRGAIEARMGGADGPKGAA